MLTDSSERVSGCLEGRGFITLKLLLWKFLRNLLLLRYGRCRLLLWNLLLVGDRRCRLLLRKLLGGSVLRELLASSRLLRFWQPFLRYSLLLVERDATRRGLPLAAAEYGRAGVKGFSRRSGSCRAVSPHPARESLAYRKLHPRHRRHRDKEGHNRRYGGAYYYRATPPLR